MEILKKLNLPNYLSLVSLFFAWISIVLILSNKPYLAVIFNLTAVIFDCLDGFMARKFRMSSDYGRHLDSFVDIFIYLIFSTMIFFKYLSPNIIIGMLIGFLVLSFGILRLVRFNEEGLISVGGHNFYRGITVAHIHFVVLTIFFITNFVHVFNNWLSFLIVFITCPLMLGNFKINKTNHMYLLVLLIPMYFLLSLILENAHH